MKNIHHNNNFEYEGVKSQKELKIIKKRKCVTEGMRECTLYLI